MDVMDRPRKSTKDTYIPKITDFKKTFHTYTGVRISPRKIRNNVLGGEIPQIEKREIKTAASGFAKPPRKKMASTITSSWRNWATDYSLEVKKKPVIKLKPIGGFQPGKFSQKRVEAIKEINVKKAFIGVNNSFERIPQSIFQNEYTKNHVQNIIYEEKVQAKSKVNLENKKNINKCLVSDKNFQTQIVVRTISRENPYKFARKSRDDKYEAAIFAESKTQKTFYQQSLSSSSLSRKQIKTQGIHQRNSLKLHLKNQFSYNTSTNDGVYTENYGTFDYEPLKQYSKMSSVGQTDDIQKSVVRASAYQKSPYMQMFLPIPGSSSIKSKSSRSPRKSRRTVSPKKSPQSSRIQYLKEDETIINTISNSRSNSPKETLQIKKSSQIFKQLDVNGNGCLSLNDIYTGLQKYKINHIIDKAYQICKSPIIDKKEFKIFLTALVIRIDYLKKFSQKAQIGKKEFQSCENWVGKIDIDAAFHELAPISFDQFCNWSIKKHLETMLEDTISEAEAEETAEAEAQAVLSEELEINEGINLVDQEIVISQRIHREIPEVLQSQKTENYKYAEEIYAPELILSQRTDIQKFEKSILESGEMH